ncbi:unnamed protein product, partial [Nesidiocoris tenuis]
MKSWRARALQQHAVSTVSILIFDFLANLLFLAVQKERGPRTRCKFENELMRKHGPAVHPSAS